MVYSIPPVDQEGPGVLPPHGFFCNNNRSRPPAARWAGRRRCKRRGIDRTAHGVLHGLGVLLRQQERGPESRHMEPPGEKKKGNDHLGVSVVGVFRVTWI